VTYNFLYLSGRITYRSINFTMSADIEYYTRLAREKLHMRQDEDAISHFQKALKCAKKSANRQHVCKCMFNLGAALVALHRTPEGLKYLESVVPLKHGRKLTGDLWYNLCLAHEDLGNITEALKYIKKAIESYSESSDDILLKAGSACRLASLYRQLRESEKAAEAYADAADSYRIANDVPQQAVCLLHQARLLACCKKSAEAIDVADQCVKLCSKQPDAGLGEYTEPKKEL